jgi:oligosaccharide 4-alpha-D-glucosyltransferase
MQKKLLLLLITSFSFAQNAERKYIDYKNENNQITLNVSDGQYLIKYYTDKIIETSFVPKGESFNSKSEAVVLKPKSVSYKINESTNILSINSKGIVTIIQKYPFQISYYNQEKLLLSEKNGYIKKDSTEVLDFNLDATEVLYGGGARALGMNRRGNRLQLYNRAHYGYETKAELMNFCMPLMLSSKIYAVHFDNAPIGYLDLDSKKDNSMQYETISGRKTYQVITGKTWQDLIENYTDLTGKQPLPARWTLGNFSSRFGYHSQDEVMQTIEKFNKEKIPVDAIILDLYWFGKDIKGTMGNLAWDKDNFPNPTKMIADLNKKGIKTVMITEPFILSTSSKWQEAVDKKILATDASGKAARYDFYFGNTGIVDIFKPEGKAWFWNIYKDLIKQGVGGLWGDLGEPEVFPSSAITAGGKADEVHNIYGHNWAKLVADGYKKDFPTVRPFILMRAGSTGSQRFGMIPWSGDVNRSWGGLQSQTEIALQMGMQGMGYMHSDLGGFAGDYLDDELYARWLQYGVFNPIFRPHAQQELASEPVNRSEKAKLLAKKAIELRYQMLPYNYNLAFENSQKGLPLMRPLLFEEPQNVDLQLKSDEYLWGNDILVVPIVEKGQVEKVVYFPKNNNWFDFYSDAKYAAGTTANIKTAEDHIPTFVRAGAFIPMIKTIENTSKYSLENFDLHYYFEEETPNSEGKLYNDDGKNAETFKDEKYEILTFNSTIANKILTINFSNQSAFFNIKTEKKIDLIIHNCKAKKARIGEKSFTVKNINGTITIPITWEIGTEKEILIQL